MTQPTNIEQLKQAARENCPRHWNDLHLLDEIVTSTYLQAVETTTIEEHKPRLELWNEAVEEGRRRERGFITSLIDGRKVVYKEGDERFYEDAKDGEEKDHIDSCCNETLDEILQSLKQTKE